VRLSLLQSIFAACTVSSYMNNNRGPNDDRDTQNRSNHLINHPHRSENQSLTSNDHPHIPFQMMVPNQAPGPFSSPINNAQIFAFASHQSDIPELRAKDPAEGPPETDDADPNGEWIHRSGAVRPDAQGARGLRECGPD
jgi:hypothetical protein